MTTFYRSVDIESVVRNELSNVAAAYCRPLPKDFALPCILVTHTGGDSESTATGKSVADHFMVVLDSRAETEAEADELLRTAVAYLEASEAAGHVEVNSLYSWGTDPVRPDLAMCSATLVITTHKEKITLEV